MGAVTVAAVLALVDLVVRLKCGRLVSCTVRIDVLMKWDIIGMKSLTKCVIIIELFKNSHQN